MEAKMPYVKTALLSAFKKHDLEKYASKLLELGVKYGLPVEQLNICQKKV